MTGRVRAGSGGIGAGSTSVLRCWRWSAACVVVVLMRVTAARAQTCMPSTSCPATGYCTRFACNANGAITFTGNTLGLSKASGMNLPGTSDAIGAFTTTNTALQVGTYPKGTTLAFAQ